MQDYQVGQILFLIADSSQVVPIQVFEQVIRTTLAGKEKTYIIKLPDKKKSTVDVKKIKGQIFSSTHEVKEYMMSNAKTAIDQMIEDAENMSINVFNVDNSLTQSLVVPSVVNKEEESISAEKNEKMQQQEDDGIIRVDLGNGKFGKIKSNELNNAGAPK